jgi:hypothetical protein
MFVAASAGEVLFNKEEGDILMHRPVTPKTLLWAKIAVLVQVSLWLAGAFNLIGFLVGLGAADGGWRFPIAHALSTSLEALFCTACVVMTYQLCLRWFGRERLEGLMTTAQVLLAVLAVVGGQLVPQLLVRFGSKMRLGVDSWWVGLLPPAWFAGLDDWLAGGGSTGSLALAVVGVAATAATLWLAFGKLAHNYEAGLQALSETITPKPKRGGRRPFIERLVATPPLKWWLRDPVERASFMLTGAYLARDRDTKLRIYPGIAPMLVMPLIFLLQERGRGGISGSGFGAAFSGAYVGLVPLLALNLLQYSQQWQASDLFRLAPLEGPGQICHGARRAVMCFLTLPTVICFGLLSWLASNDPSHLALLVPGIIALPVYALIPNLGGKGVLLSQPIDDAKSARRGLTMMGVMFISMALGGIARWAWSAGWFAWMLGGEALVALGVYSALRLSLTRARWRPLE